MAGSMRWFDYNSDDATLYAINADESNVEVANGAGDSGPATTNATLGKGVYPRYATYLSDLGRQKRIPILTQTRYATMVSLLGVPATFPDQRTGETFVLVRLNPERRLRQPLVAIDTGLNDGDSPG